MEPTINMNGLELLDKQIRDIEFHLEYWKGDIQRKEAELKEFRKIRQALIDSGAIQGVVQDVYRAISSLSN
jgi:hypothetical protein